jgi:hypothetical protein
LLAGITLQPTDDELRIVCHQVGDIGTVEAQIAPHVRVALREYTWQPFVCVVARASSVPPPPRQAQPPAWIAPARWISLPALLQAMLLGSTLEDGELRCVSAGLTRQVENRYSEQLAALLAERPLETQNATRCV